MVCFDTPTSRATSSALRPASNCFSAPIICASVCLLFDILSSPSFRTNHTQLCAETGEQVRRIVRPIPALGPRAIHSVQNEYPQIVGNQARIEIDYESLSGLKYQTLITWNEDALVIRFNPPRP